MQHQEIVSKAENKWQEVQKQAKERRLTSARVEIWHIAAPRSARISALLPQQLGGYSLDPARPLDEGAIAQWIDDASFAASVDGGKHTFEFAFCFFEDAVSRVKFVLDGGASTSPGATSTTPATSPTVAPYIENQAHSLVRVSEMLIRHQEKMFEMFLKNTQQNLDYNEKQIARLGARVEHLEADRQNLIVRQEEILILQQERELAAAKSARQDKRNDVLFSKAMLVATAFFKQTMSSAGGKSRATARDIAFKEFVNSLDMETFEKMMVNLTPEQQLLVSEIISGVQDEIEEDEEKNEKKANGKANGKTEGPHA